MTTLSGLGRSGAGIKSIQRGVTTPTSIAEVVVTVTAVNPAKSMLNLLSSSFDSGTDNTTRVSIRLINASSVGVTSFSSIQSVRQALLPCSWELIEFE